MYTIVKHLHTFLLLTALERTAFLLSAVCTTELKRTSLRLHFSYVQLHLIQDIFRNLEEQIEIINFIPALLDKSLCLIFGRFNQ